MVSVVIAELLSDTIIGLHEYCGFKHFIKGTESAENHR